MIGTLSSLFLLTAPVLALIVTIGPDVRPSSIGSSRGGLGGVDTVDQGDLAYLFDRMALTRGRYVFQPGEKPFSLDFVIEEYVDGELRDSASTNRMMLASLPGFEESKAELYIRAMLAHTIVDSVAREGRIYVDQGNAGVAHVSLVLDEGRRIGLPLEVDTGRFGGGGAHPFSFDRLRQGERKPLMAIYYVPRGEGFVPCPADAPAPTIIETYPMVWIIYGEGVPLD